MKFFAIAFAAFALTAGAAFAASDDAAGDDTAAAAPPSVSDDASYDAQFQCPETLASRDARIAEYAGWTAWARQVHPNWNFKKRLDVRYGLLRRHGCAATLAAIANSERPAFSPQ